MAGSIIKFDDILDQIPMFNDRGNYWFLRTEGGSLYRDFVNHGYVSVGHDLVTVEMLRKLIALRSKNKPDEDDQRALMDFEKSVRKAIAQPNPDGLNNKKTESSKEKYLSAQVRQLVEFAQIRQGDVIVIPSTSTDYVSIGQVVSDLTQVDAKKHRKRFDVDWQSDEIALGSMLRVHPELFSLKYRRQFLTKLDDLSKFIDSYYSGAFTKDGDSYLRLQVDIKEEVDLLKFSEYTRSLYDVLKLIEGVLDDDNSIVESTSIQLTLNSPGTILLKTPVDKLNTLGADGGSFHARALVLLGLLGVAFSGCSDEDLQKKAAQVDRVIEVKAADDQMVANFAKLQDEFNVSFPVDTVLTKVK